MGKKSDKTTFSKVQRGILEWIGSCLEHNAPRQYPPLAGIDATKSSPVCVHKKDV